MALYNSNRSGIIQIIIGVVVAIIVGQLISLQIFSNRYKLAADNNAIFRKIIYPDRGIIYDRKKRALLENTISYDLVVIPNEAKGVDTAALCEILKYVQYCAFVLQMPFVKIYLMAHNMRPMFPSIQKLHLLQYFFFYMVVIILYVLKL